MADHQAITLLSDEDLYLFHEGSHFRMFERLGAHKIRVGDVEGVIFGVYAPSARTVSVIGDFNHWDPNADPMTRRGTGGAFERFIPGVNEGAAYKYHIVSNFGGYTVDKADPYSFYQELPPRTASRVFDLFFEWHDSDWMRNRGAIQALDQPMTVYEVHLGSWLRGEGNRRLTYTELAPRLSEYVRDMGFTHIQLLPVSEHPFYGSWGYGVSGYFAVTSRYGNPREFMRFVEQMHREGIGVLLDWVPAHFPSDEAALGFFDGTHLYEHADPRKGFHPDWKSLIFNLGRPEVRSFLISNAMFWLDRYNIDGLRVDAVASMLYLDYSRKEGEWIPNQYGGRENIEAIEFLKRFNTEVYAAFPDVQTIAEESTSWPMVSRPVSHGGLGFGLKWDMGWMHDTLKYRSTDPLFRKERQNEITFRQLYADCENFMLPLSHDEVVHGKGSLYSRMPGDGWQKCANLRLLFGWMFAQNGKKLIFMGSEFGQRSEWYHETGLEWPLLEHPLHAGVREFVKSLNSMHRKHASMHSMDAEQSGFEWIDCQDADSSVLILMRRSREPLDEIVAVFNFTPVPRHDYRIGVPSPGRWSVLLNSDDPRFGGAGDFSGEDFESEAKKWHGREHSLVLSLPPLAVMFLKVRSG
ncbi:MAG: 1,4-alpha-glucan branching protein GlgB [Planctomycetota bacterium]